MAYCKFCNCLLSCEEISSELGICNACKKSILEGKRYFGSIYGWLSYEDCVTYDLNWNDGKTENIKKKEEEKYGGCEIRTYNW